MRSIVEYIGPNKTSHPCGYCKSDKPENSSYGLWAHLITTEQYQILIDRGWRRSGKFCYKSDMDRICCPAFAIRCEALRFKPSRSQRKVIKRFHNFIYFGIKPKFADKILDEETSRPSLSRGSPKRFKHNFNSPEVNLNRDSSGSCSAPKRNDEDPMTEPKAPSTSTTLTTKANPCDPKSSDVAMKDRTQKAKFKRFQRRAQRLSIRENCSLDEALSMIREKVQKKQQQLTRSFEDYFAKPAKVDKPAHKLEIKFISTCDPAHVRYLKVSHELYEKYQTVIHKDDPSECAPKQFKRFLVDNPFESKPFYSRSKDVSIPISYGTHHMQYWLDGKLIIVAVLDVLANSVSSVYLFYDPEYNFLRLGTYSALREILLVRNLHEINPQIQYYYLGLYIHSCIKMNYKGKFHPSYLLCHQAFTWHPIERCRPLLDAIPAPRLEDDLDKQDEDGINIEDKNILIRYGDAIILYSHYKRLIGTHDSKEVYEYASLVGKKCTSSISLYRKEIETTD